MSNDHQGQAVEDLKRLGAFEASPRPLADALSKALEGISRLVDTELLATGEAFGRVLAQGVTAARDIPEFPTSMMDGYALSTLNHGQSSSAESTAAMAIQGKSLAGKPFRGEVELAAAHRIFTGAVVPEGYDVVVPQERVAMQPDGQITVPRSELRLGNNIRPRGEDLRQGQTAIAQGQIIAARELALLGSMGFARIEVFRRVRVAVVSTGDELRDLHRPLAEGQIYDANRLMLLHLVRQCGALPIDLGIVPDDPAALQAALIHAASVADLVVTSGGVSVGEADHTRRVMADLGKVGFWKLALKPGRPLAVGEIRGEHGQGVPFFGLPGNPVASFVTFLAIVRPAILKRAGADYRVHDRRLRARLARDTKKQAGRTEYLRCHLTQAADGAWLADIMASQGAASLKSLMDADGLVVLPHEAGPLSAGDWVDVIFLQGL